MHCEMGGWMERRLTDGWRDRHVSGNKPFLPRASVPSRLRPQSYRLSIFSGTHRKRGTWRGGKKERRRYQWSNPTTSFNSAES